MIAMISTQDILHSMLIKSKGDESLRPFAHKITNKIIQQLYEEYRLWLILERGSRIWQSGGGLAAVTRLWQSLALQHRLTHITMFGTLLCETGKHLRAITMKKDTCLLPFRKGAKTQGPLYAYLFKFILFKIDDTTIQNPQGLMPNRYHCGTSAISWRCRRQTGCRDSRPRCCLLARVCLEAAAVRAG